MGRKCIALDKKTIYGYNATMIKIAIIALGFAGMLGIWNSWQGEPTRLSPEAWSQVASAERTFASDALAKNDSNVECISQSLALSEDPVWSCRPPIHQKTGPLHNWHSHRAIGNVSADSDCYSSLRELQDNIMSIHELLVTVLPTRTSARPAILVKLQERRPLWNNVVRDCKP